MRVLYSLDLTPDMVWPSILLTGKQYAAHIETSFIKQTIIASCCVFELVTVDTWAIIEA